MSTYAVPPPPVTPGRHRAPAASLSRDGWRRIRTVVTVSVAGAATVVGIGLGLNGAAVSPVSVTAVAADTPAGTTTQAPTEADNGGGDGPHDGAGHRHGARGR